MNELISGAQKLGIHLFPGQIEQFETYYRELVAWNQRINLTAITGYEEAQTRHFLDSLTVVSAFRPEDRANPPDVIDIGTGAGLPGIPVKIARPEIRLTLLEATAKKTRFLDHVIKKLGLENVEIITGRAEEAAHDGRYRERFDIVLSRAVAPLPVLVELALPFCAAGGRVIAQKKGEIDEEADRAGKAIDLLGGARPEIRPVELEELPDSRVLVVIDKIGPTPPGYPRRPGIPAKRPIMD
jgi:16S rRNA (guanine527-N7)-methyltransferase